MANPIKLTSELLKECVSEFEKTLKEMILRNGEIKFEKKYRWKGDQKATILVTPTAYQKMKDLVNGFKTEVAWHGTVTRIDETTFRIDDILVYPQKVSSGTVVVDAPYTKWCASLDTDIINKMRMQGHSHVKFATTPSQTDLTTQSEQLDYLGDDTFYIFMILNQENSLWSTIYDLKNNTRYDTSDIVVKIDGDTTDREEFMKAAKKMATSETKVTTAGTSSPFNYGNYGSKTPASNSYLRGYCD